MTHPFVRVALALSWLVMSGCSDDRTGNSLGVGNACADAEDCATGECYLGPAGGYCTSPCSEEGDQSECPLDTVCKPIQGGARRCLLVCGSESACGFGPDECGDDSCPAGSSCVSIAETRAARMRAESRLSAHGVR